MSVLEFNNKGFYVQVEFNQQQNIEANTSTVTVTNIRVKATSWVGVIYYLNGAVTVGGKRISVDNKGVYIQEKGEYASVNNASGSVTIHHLNDGTLTTTIGVEISGYTTSGGAGSGWKVTGTESVTLETIPRASTISLATDTVLGTPCRVQWIPMSADFKYKLEFKIGKGVKTTDFIQPNTTALYTYAGYTIPLDEAASIPEKTQETMTVTLYTYSAGEEQIGEADTEEFTVTVPDNDSTKPTVSIDALTPVTALSSPFGTIFVQGKSKVKVSYTGAGKYGATVKSYSISVNGKPSEDTSDYLSEYGTIPVKVTAVDSRGFSNSVTETIEVLPYTKPRIVPIEGEKEVICTRCDANGKPKDDGEYLLVKAATSISELKADNDPLNTPSMWFRWKLASAPDSGYSDKIALGGTVNLFDKTQPQYSGAYCKSSLVDGDLVVTTTSSGSYVSANFLIPNGESLVGKTVTISGEWETSGANSGCVRLAWVNKDNKHAHAGDVGMITTSGKSVTKTVGAKPDNAGELCLWLYGNLSGTGSTGATVSYRNVQLKIGSATDSEPQSGDSYDGRIESVVFNKANSYVVQIGVTDDVGESASMTFTILSEKVYWHRGEDFLALGMHTSSGGFEVAWDARFYGDVYVGEVSLADYIRKIIQGG